MYACIPTCARTHTYTDVLVHILFFEQIVTYSEVSFDHLKYVIDIIDHTLRERGFLLISHGWICYSSQETWSFDLETTVFLFHRITLREILMKLSGLLLSLVLTFSLHQHTIVFEIVCMVLVLSPPLVTFIPMTSRSIVSQVPMKQAKNQKEENIAKKGKKKTKKRKRIVLRLLVFSRGLRQQMITDDC